MSPPPTLTERRPDLPAALDGVIAQGMSKDPWSRPSRAAELIQSASRALSSSTTFAAVPPAPGSQDGDDERRRRVQTTKVPSVGSPGGAGDAAVAAAADSAPAVRSDETRTRSVIPRMAPAASDHAAPVADPAAAPSTAPPPDPDASTPATPGAVASAGPRSVARAGKLPPRFLALIAALVILAFAVGFVLGLVVH
jgi:serine/threonine-protein kinase